MESANRTEIQVDLGPGRQGTWTAWRYTWKDRFYGADAVKRTGTGSSSGCQTPEWEVPSTFH